MYISQELRKSNIAEYLLYMWQIEDTIRAFDCSLSRIRHEYIDRFDYTDEQKEDVADWFGHLISRSISRNTIRYCRISWNSATKGLIVRRTR